MEDELWTATKTQWFHGISAPTLGEYVKSGFPKNGRNKYPAKAGNDWIRKVLLSSDEDGDISREKLLGERARRKLNELKFEIQNGTLVPREESLLWVGQLISECRSNLLYLPHRLSESLAVENDARVIQEILRNEVRQILTILYEGRTAHEKKNSINSK